MNVDFLTTLLAVVDEEPPDLSWLGPVVLTTGSIIVALIGGVSLVWRRRQDKKDLIKEKEVDLQPKVIDGWEEVRKARAEATAYYNLYRVFENLYYTAAAALRKLARTVRDHHPDEEFDKDVVDALALKPPDTDASK